LEFRDEGTWAMKDTFVDFEEALRGWPNPPAQSSGTHTWEVEEEI